MKVHLKWIHVVAAVAAAGWNVPDAGAQYAPYRPQQTMQQPVAGYPTTSQPAVAPMARQPYAGYGAPAVAPQVQAPQAPVPQARAPQVAAAPNRAPTAAQYPQTAAQLPAYSYPQTAQAPIYQQQAPIYPQTAQATAYPQAATYPQAPSYPRIAQAPSGPGYETYGYQIAQQPDEPAPPTPPTPAIPPMPAENEALPAPVPANGAAAVEPSPPAVEAAQPAAGYPSSGYQTGGGYAGYGQNSCGYTDYGINGCCEEPCESGHQWFGGVYFLFMERDNPNPAKIAVRVDHDTVTDPYYPQGHTTVLSTEETDYGWQEGVEVRFGSTFSCGNSCDEGCGAGNGYGGACGCGPSCPPPDNFAWEVAWWGLDEDGQDENYVDLIPTDRTRMYGMINFAGLQYDSDGDNTGWRPMNDYYGYGLPIDDPDPPVDGDVIVLAQRVRTNFSAQNVELNLIRFPICSTGCSSSCSGNSCGYDACGYPGCGCEEESCPIAFSMYGMCGVRYFRMDDDFYLANEFGVWDSGIGGYDQGAYNGFSGDNGNELYYDINVDNNLLGPQVGWNMNYCVGSKWNFFWNSTFGIFNNYIQHYQRLWAGGDGWVQDAQSGRTFVVNSDKDDISFLGELRVGGSYDISCNWRAVLAYRALAITGIANSVDQIPTDFTSPEYVAIIDSDSSIIIHGVQLGAECRY